MAEQSTSKHTQSEETIVAAQGLTKVFKDFWHRDRARAVDGIDFQIGRGEIFGLLGPNGSGKSTTIKMILGLLKKTSGRLIVFGKAPSEVTTKKRIGYLPEESYLYPFLNARETLDYYGKLFNLDARTRAERIDGLLDMVGLTAVQFRQVREYSKGMQRRIGLAQALINDPEFLILDEPTTGLDPIGTRQVKDLIVELGRRGKTILLSSHLLADVEDVVDRMVILYGGKIRAEGSCEELLEARERNVIETDELDEATIEELRSVLEKRNHTVERITRPRQKLEELFVGIVEQARAEQIATSGATHAGSTASFLQSDEKTEAKEGEALIESLIETEPAPASAAPDDAAPVAQAPEEEEGASVIADLLETQDGSSSGAKAAGAQASSDEAGSGPDEDMIADLLGGPDEDPRDRP